MSEKNRILIVDDDEDYGNALSIVLENSGYKVEHVLNIKEGREAIDRVPPDLVILDVMMDNHTDGFELCSDLKNDEACRMIPIIMVTAVTEKTDFKFSPETDGEYLKADDYVSKPVPVAELLSRVNKLIGKNG
ncbi:MAG: response regulator transcription factor [Thermodesulfobacteriota bacterium]|nr:response regulator transcription factor [Thermodesulfobacteriota bacterium]